MEHLRTSARAIGLAALLLLSAAVAVAQTLPRENHYRVYRTLPATYTSPITLTDQFGQLSISTMTRDRFANPAEKRIPGGGTYPIIDPVVHQLWWRIDTPQPTRTVIVLDQFGIAQWRLGDAVYLLNPALKDVPEGVPPTWNHYVCYSAEGPTLGRPVILIDQFGTCEVVLMQGRLLCNPAAKRDATGNLYPIVDQSAHLACYLFQTATPFTRPITAIDQFGNWQLELLETDGCCVPALKEHVLKTQESTWGGIKAMYR